MTTFTVQTEHGTPVTGTLRLGTYATGALAVQMETDEGHETLSVNLVAYGMVAPAGHFHAPSMWADGVEAAGIAVKVEPVAYGPFNSTGHLMRLVAS